MSLDSTCPWSSHRNTKLILGTAGSQPRTVCRGQELITEHVDGQTACHATRREVLCSFVVIRRVRRQQAGSAGRCQTETQRTMNLSVLAWAAIHSQTWRWQDDHPRHDLSVYSDLMTRQEDLCETRRSQMVEKGCRPATEQGSLHGRQEQALLLPEGSFAC